jgi:hypothetical protein
MFMSRLIILCGAILGIALPFVIFGADNCRNPDTYYSKYRDFQAVQTFVNQRRIYPLHDKKKEFRLTGDVRANYFFRRETQDGVNLRGHGAVNAAGLPIPQHTYETEFNLRFDYRAERSWAYAHLNFDNDWGINGTFKSVREDPNGLFGSGFCNDICLKRCYLGYMLLECPKVYTLSVEIGRFPLNFIFESYDEFRNRFDGIYFKYSRNIKPSSNFYIKGGPFVVDSRVNHFAFVFETGFLDFMEWKVDWSYSFIDWRKLGVNRAFTHDALGNRFQISQVAVSYDFPKKVFWGKPAQIYGAWLINSAATRNRFSNFKLANTAWYVGFLIGEVKKKGDWAFEISYDYVHAQSIPDTDVSGFDRGNVLGDSFYVNSRGKANYKGLEIETLYAVTDRFSISSDIVVFSHAINNDIGGPHTYNKIEIDFIVAF